MKTTMTPDSGYDEFPTQRHVQGDEAIIEANLGWKQAFPDAKGTVRNVLARDNLVAMDVTWQGTNAGPMESPSSATPPSARGSARRDGDDVRGAKIKEMHHYFDAMGLLKQLGATPQYFLLRTTVRSANWQVYCSLE
jgi:SnoaL-like polyketide cyclase